VNLKPLFPHGSASFFDLNRSVSPAEPQPDKAKPLGKTIQRKEKSLGRTTLSYTGFFVRPQDPDNFAASTKDLTDGLRRCGLLHGDEPWNLKLICEQEKVNTFAEERISIKITP
jgi:hypothetical protein